MKRAPKEPLSESKDWVNQNKRQ